MYVEPAAEDGNCPTDYSSYGLGLCGIKFRASHAIDATLSP